MRPLIHIISGAIFILIIYFLFPNLSILNLSIVFLASFLIDIDHYIYFVYKKKDFSLKNAYYWFSNCEKKWRKLSYSEKLKYKIIPILFHGIEFLAILILLSYFNKIFYFVLFGSIFHIFIDYVEIIYYREPLYMKFSQIYLLIRNKRKLEFHNK